MSKKDESWQIEQLLKVVVKQLKKHGLKKIVRVLREADLEENNLYFSKIYDYIINLTLETFDVSREHLFGFKKRGEVTKARRYAIILIKKHLKISDEHLGLKFHRCRQVIYNVQKEYESLDPKNPIDQKQFFNDFVILDKKVIKYTKSLNIK